MKNIPDPVFFERETLYILDQRKLPFKEVYFKAKRYNDVKRAIKNMLLRGAPLIGIAGAYGVYLGLKKSKKIEEFYRMKDELLSIRKTSFNLFYSLLEIEKVLKKGGSLTDIKRVIDKVFSEEKKRCRLIAENGKRVINKKGVKVLTHCNTGKLATGGMGTALGVIYKSRDNISHVFVTETRPYFQGARLTAYELSRIGIPYTIVLDSEVSYMMLMKEIDLVVVGADRITRKGDTANKIGTFSIALSANNFGIPFYVAAPLTTFDLNTDDFHSIPIEVREGKEMRGWGKTRWIPDNYSVLYFSFDVTPFEYITKFITDKGVFSCREIEKYVKNGL
jgi:methylthioribose-1-phosphate isomerase